MPILIGTDEAGYGPNLGPLVISASCWETESESDSDLGKLFQAPTLPIEIADSKQLYQPHGTLARLETGVLTFLSLLDERFCKQQDWKELLIQLDPAAKNILSSVEWYQNYQQRIPVDILAKEVNRLRQQLSLSLVEHACQFLQLSSRIIFPAEFNQGCQQLGSKGALLSTETMLLVRKQLLQLQGDLPTADAELSAEKLETPILVRCDRHGGRKRYYAILQHVFPEIPWRIVSEEPRSSRYAWEVDDKLIMEVRFDVGGEAFPPAALASMTCKYVRELAMKSFNAFWKKQVPGIQPTAGYPVDAKRFLAEIAATLPQLNISDEQFWRNK